MRTLTNQNHLSRRLNRSHNRVRQASRDDRDRSQAAMSQAQVKEVEEAGDKHGSVFIVGRRPPLTNFPFVWQWLGMLVYKRLCWTGIDYGGVFYTEAEARYAASEYGGFYMEAPWSSCLPPVTCQYGSHDFPLSKNSIEYRKRMFPFVAVHRDTLAKVIYFEEQLDKFQERLDAFEHRLADYQCAA